MDEISCGERVVLKLCPEKMPGQKLPCLLREVIGSFPSFFSSAHIDKKISSVTLCVKIAQLSVCFCSRG
jgi:hypothetical protein